MFRFFGLGSEMDVIRPRTHSDKFTRSHMAANLEKGVFRTLVAGNHIENASNLFLF